MDLNGFDLNLLAAFEALLEERHVTRAAMRLGLSQPAMSAALSRLRRATGDELFVRGPRTLSPTPHALELSRPLGAALRSIRETLALGTSFVSASSTQVFHIAAADHAASMILPTVVARATREAPGVDLRIRALRDRREAIRLLDDGTIDVAIGVSPGHEARILQEKLFEEPFVTIARAGMVTDVLRDPANFASRPHLLVSPESEDHGVVDIALARLGLRRRIAVSVADLQTAIDIVACSDLIATVMEGAVLASSARSRLLVVPPPVVLDPVQFRMLWHRRSNDHPAQVWLRRIIGTESSGCAFTRKSLSSAQQLRCAELNRPP